MSTKPREFWREEAMMFPDKREPYFTQWVPATPETRHAGEAVALLERMQSDWMPNERKPDEALLALQEMRDAARELLERIKREMGE
jgi:hypothetical protein